MLIVADFETVVPLKKEELGLSIDNEDKNFKRDHKKYKKYLKGFETSVWLSGFQPVDKHKDLTTIKTQTSIQDFFAELYDFCDTQGKQEYVCFFHNLKFDGSYLTNFLAHNDIEFETFINDMGAWYSVTVEFEDFKIVFRDSLKVLNFNLKTIADLFDMEMAKGETPLLNTPPEEIKPEWKEYINVDINILATAIYNMYMLEGFTKFTSGSEALAEFKTTLNFRKMFPVLNEEIDVFCRGAYRGGWTYVKESIREKDIFEYINVYDINSMYPSCMLNYALPYGKPKLIGGKPDNFDDLTISEVYLNIKLKEKHLPTLQTKSRKIADELKIKTTDYIKTTNGFAYKFFLTNYDLKQIYEHYHVNEDDTHYIQHYKFKSQKGMFDDYILKYKELKENAKTPSEKNKSKIMLNSLYGKFGARILQQRKLVSLGDRGQNVFTFDEEEDVTPQYVPMATFITSICRYNIIASAQQNYDNFLYADTDSLHMLCRGEKPNLHIHPNEFGAWKLETPEPFVYGKYLRSKLYIEQEANGKLHVVGSGLTDEIKKQITVDNFKIGSVFNGKRATMQVKGGVIIYETLFTIKDGLVA